jgi:HPt (histidine-containing phosphotransfer) domain-containing protein
MTNTTIDIEGLKRIAAGDEKFVQEILTLYTERTTSDLKELKVASDQKDWNTVQFLTHRMRSASVPLGAKSLLTFLKKAELSLKSGNTEGIEGILESINAEAIMAIEAAKNQLKSTAV